MNIWKIAVRAVVVLIGLPILFTVILFGFLYSVFYFPNWSSAAAGTLISAGEKRECLLYVPKNYDRAKPAARHYPSHVDVMG